MRVNLNKLIFVLSVFCVFTNVNAQVATDTLQLASTSSTSTILQVVASSTGTSSTPVVETKVEVKKGRG